jgi:hypothetical protein
MKLNKSNKSGTTNCAPQYDQYGDPIPCYKIYESGGSNPSGGVETGNPTNGSSGTGSTGSNQHPGSYQVTIYSIECFCHGQLIGVHGHTQTVTYVYIYYKPNPQLRAASDCPDCQIPVSTIPVNTISSLVESLKTELNLTTQQYRWLMGKDQVAADFKAYLLNNPTQIARQYVSQIISQMVSTPNSPLANNVTLVRPPTTVSEITDINDYLKCFDKTQPASFTLYVDQPTANSNTPWSGNPLSPDVGHTFISIKQGGTRRLIGFYPGVEVDLSAPATAGVFHDNSAHEYDVSISLVINPLQLNNLLSFIKTKSTATYNLNSYNCTDFGMGAAALAGLSLPSAYGTWGAPGVGTGAGDNPGQLGQNIRALPTPTGAVKSTSSGTALSNTGTCL